MARNIFKYCVSAVLLNGNREVSFLFFLWARNVVHLWLNFTDLCLAKTENSLILARLK